MREIKFRAWDKKFNIMCYTFPNLFYINLKGQVINTSVGDVSEDWVLQKYTGLKDKNGKEIYEGDIISLRICKLSKIELGRTMKAQVAYFELKAAFGLKEAIRYFSNMLSIERRTIEVLGNIYENPELLKNDTSNY